MQLICGFYHLTGRAATDDLLQAMIRPMIEPGLTPKVRTWLDGPVALARLDFGTEAKPAGELPRGAGGVVLAADARIDAVDGQESGDGRDAESTILRALAQRGDDAIERLAGDFSLAAFDPISRRLICARDHMGARPFHYTHRPGEIFAFASLPRGLHGAGLASRALNERFLAQVVLGLPVEGERSLFRDIARLPPAHLLRVSPAGVVERAYWQLRATTVGTSDPLEAAGELRRRVETAVRRRLPAHGPVGAHLSGGLDSSALGVLAARLLREQARELFAYSFLSTPPPGLTLQDEASYVAAVLAQEPDIRWTAIRITPGPGWITPRMDVDQPLPLGGFDPEEQVCIDAAAHGVSTILSGWGGDEGATFNGRGVLAEAALHGRFRYLVSEVLALRQVRKWSLGRVLRNEVLHYLLPLGFQAFARRIALRPAEPDPHWRALLSRDLADLLDQPELSFGPSGMRNRLQLLTSSHLSLRNEQYTLIGARHGIAFAFPLLDRQVVEFAASLPSAMFLRGGWKRRVFRDAMAGVLPETVRWRHEKLTPFPEFAIAFASQKDVALQWMSQLRHHARASALFDLDAIERRLRAFPSAEEMTREAARAEAGVSAQAAPMTPFLRVLRAAAYVEQHH
jgi:asparagine synthase (glutamine-hydrolysing)